MLFHKGIMIPQTLEELEAIPDEVLTVEQIAKILHRTPDYLRLAARSPKSNLGFAVIVAENTVTIPKRAFIHFMRYGNAPILEAKN